jgi:hypothetical protein
MFRLRNHQVLLSKTKVPLICDFFLLFALQVPRVPIVPRNVSVPNVDWEELNKSDSRDSCVQRYSKLS